MAERLPVIRLQPERVIDWGAFIGASRALLATTYPAAHLVAVEPDAGRREASAAAFAPPWWSPRRWTGGGAPVLLPGEVGAAQCELLWANMSLHAAPDPLAVMRQWHRAVAAGGFLMFSTFGPGTLANLSALYAGRGWPPPLAPFVDMHDLGDMLLEAGFAEPVMDQETLTLTWPSAEALLVELRQLGGNVDHGRFAGLRTPRWRRQLVMHLQALAEATGRLPMRFEIVYGHAFRPALRAKVAAESALPLDELRAQLKSGRRRI